MHTILIVDDEKELGTVMKEMLEMQNFKCIHVENGEAGLKILKEEPVSLVITDIIMPKMNGIHFIKEIKAIKAELPIIAISGGGKNSAEDYLKSVGNLGVTKTFEKPFDLTELSLSCKQLLNLI